MILMWLGSFVLMMYGITESQKHLAALFAPVQKKVLGKGLDGSVGQLFPRAVALVMAEASPQKSLYAGMALKNMRVLGVRSSVLLMCLSTLGAWWMLLLGMFFLGFSGLFLMGFGAILLFGLARMDKLKELVKVIFSAGLFLLGGEMVLRQGRIIPMMLGESDWAFFLADGRFGAVFGILALAFVLSIFIEVEFWSVALALSLLVGGVISINGAIGLVAGERLARVLWFYLRSRHLNDTCRKIGLGFSIASLVGVIVGFFAAGFVREGLPYIYSSEGEVLQDKVTIFMVLWSVIIGFQLLAQMIWGHWGGAYQESELQEVRYFPKTWISKELIGVSPLKWATAKLHSRLSEIRYHLQGLSSLKEGQVPEHIQARLKSEEQEVSKLVHMLSEKEG